MEQHSKKVFYISFAAGLCVAFGFIYFIYMLDAKAIKSIWILKKIYASNVRIYIVFLLLFGGTFFSVREIAFLLLQKQYNTIRPCIHVKNPVQIICVSILSLAGFFMFCRWGFIDQFSEYGCVNGSYYDFPMSFRFIITLMVFLWVVCTIIKGNDISEATLYLVYTFSVLVTFMNLFILNPFKPSLMRSSNFSMVMFDITSVTETIYNVLKGVPFDNATSGLYGHYAIVFLPFVKVAISILKFFAWITGKAGRSITQVAVMGSLAGFGCLAQIATIYAINAFSNKRWIKALLALASVIRITYTYPACSPIRTFFPLMMCCYMVFLYKNNKIARLIGGG